jgi:hypothetical protein
MQYLLLIYGPEIDYSQFSPEDVALEMKAWNEYTDWLKDKGWFVGGDALQRSDTATTVREKDGKPVTTDGPFVESKEQLGGYYMVNCDNLDDAVDAASRIPSVSRGGSIEVRPVQTYDEEPS